MSSDLVVLVCNLDVRLVVYSCAKQGLCGGVGGGQHSCPAACISIHLIQPFAVANKVCVVVVVSSIAGESRQSVLHVDDDDDDDDGDDDGDDGGGGQHSW